MPAVKGKGKRLIPIRVLHVFGRIDRGGAEMMIMNVYRHIDRCKVQFDFVAHTYDRCDLFDEIESLGGRIYPIPRFNGINLFTYKKAWKCLLKARSSTCDIIHSHIRSTASLYLPIARKFGYTTIAHSHSTAVEMDIRGKLKNLLQWRMKWQNIDYYFACSRKAGKWLFGKKIVENQLILLKNAIDTQSFVFNPSIREKTRRDLNVSDAFVIGHVGRFISAKNHSFLIDVFARIARQDPSVVLLLIGDGELRQRMAEKVDKLGLESRVIFTGVRTDIPQLMQAMDVLVFPSLYEGLGVTLIEAQAAGLPCIISNSIPDEVMITDLVEALPLKAPVAVWGEKIVSKRAFNRQDMSAAVKQAGYDVTQTAAWLEKFYLETASHHSTN